MVARTVEIPVLNVVSCRGYHIHLFNGSVLGFAVLQKELPACNCSSVSNGEYLLHARYARKWISDRAVS